MSEPVRKLPPWLKRPWPAGHSFQHTRETVESLGLETICTNANCPNRGECWGRGTATVLILGNVCTRNCRFCSVATGKPQPPDPTEPARLADMARRMNIRYLVITSVNRDDLPDGGAGHFRDCINEVRRQCPSMRFEILTPDFQGCTGAGVGDPGGRPAVRVRAQRRDRSVALPGGPLRRQLRDIRCTCCGWPTTGIPGVQTKSSIMLGLGESDAEVEQVLRDLRQAGCDRLTIGQYLKPSKDSLEVVEYVTPEKFAWWKERATEIGFSWVLSSPFARSSYFAEQENAR